MLPEVALLFAGGSLGAWTGLGLRSGLARRLGRGPPLCLRLVRLRIRGGLWLSCLAGILRVGCRLLGRLRLALGFLAGGEVALAFLVRLEIGLVPAAALEAEHRRRDQPLHRLLLAARALPYRRIGDLL